MMHPTINEDNASLQSFIKLPMVRTGSEDEMEKQTTAESERVTGSDPRIWGDRIQDCAGEECHVETRFAVPLELS